MKLSNYINTLISNTPFLEYYIDEGLLNYSAMSKKIKQILSRKNIKTSEASILMSLKRYHFPFEHKRKQLSFFISDIGQIQVNSNLKLLRFEKNNLIPDLKLKLNELAKSELFYFFIFEAESYITLVLKMNQNESNIINESIKVLEIKEYLTTISLNFSNENIAAPGLYYVLFKQFAWNNINIYEVSSSGREVTLLIENKDVDKVFKMIHQEKVDFFN